MNSVNKWKLRSTLTSLLPGHLLFAPLKSRWFIQHFIVAGFMAGTIFMTGCDRNPYTQGKSLYRYHCENCHMADGSGLASLIPALDAERLKLSDPQKLVCLIHNGLPFNNQTRQQMPANKGLNDVELTNLINFLGYRYSETRQTVKVEDVQKMLATCQSE